MATPRARIFAALRAEGVSTVRELAGLTGLSRPTVTATLGELARDGLVDTKVTAAAPDERGGRPAARYRFRAERHHVLGLDVSDSHQRLAIADLSGRIVHTDIDGPACPRSAADGITVLGEAVRAAFRRARLSPDSLAGATVAVPGIVGRDGRLTYSAAFRGWEDVDLGGMLSEAFGCPVTIENDLVLAAAAEARLGAARLADTSLFLLTWYHVSARLVSGRRVHLGRHHQAGEMGSLRMLTGPRRGDENPWEWADEIDARLATARDGDSAGLAAVEHLTDRMAPAVAGLLAAYDPDLVVLGGRLGKYADLIAPQLQAKAAAELDLSWEYPIVGHALGELDSSVGAVLRAFESTGPALLGDTDAPVPAITLDASAVRDQVPARETQTPV